MDPLNKLRDVCNSKGFYNPTKKVSCCYRTRFRIADLTSFEKTTFVRKSPEREDVVILRYEFVDGHFDRRTSTFDIFGERRETRSHGAHRKRHDARINL